MTDNKSNKNSIDVERANCVKQIEINSNHKDISHTDRLPWYKKLDDLDDMLSGQDAGNEITDY